jgi:hypothetical protein
VPRFSPSLLRRWIVESEPDGVKDALLAFGEVVTDEFLAILDDVISERSWP